MNNKQQSAVQNSTGGYANKDIIARFFPHTSLLIIVIFFFRYYRVNRVVPANLLSGTCRNTNLTWENEWKVGLAWMITPGGQFILE